MSTGTHTSIPTHLNKTSDYYLEITCMRVVECDRRWCTLTHRLYVSYAFRSFTHSARGCCWIPRCQMLHTTPKSYLKPPSPWVNGEKRSESWSDEIILYLITRFFDTINIYGILIKTCRITMHTWIVADTIRLLAWHAPGAALTIYLVFLFGWSCFNLIINYCSRVRGHHRQSHESGAVVLGGSQRGQRGVSGYGHIARGPYISALVCDPEFSCLWINL